MIQQSTRVLHTSDSLGLPCGMDDQELTVIGQAGWALGPPEPHLCEPSMHLLAVPSLAGVFGGPELPAESLGTKQRYLCRAFVDRPSPPNQPRVEVEGAGCIRESGNNSAFDRDAVLLDFVIEGVAEGDYIVV
jgi:hypothetical protein